MSRPPDTWHGRRKEEEEEEDARTDSKDEVKSKVKAIGYRNAESISGDPLQGDVVELPGNPLLQNKGQLMFIYKSIINQINQSMYFPPYCLGVQGMRVLISSWHKLPFYDGKEQPGPRMQ